jgi:hypothetical protein
MKMAAHLLDSVGATLRADSERLRFWIYNRPIEGVIQSTTTPRDRQQIQASLRGRTLRVVPQIKDSEMVRPRDEKFMAKMRTSKWAAERHLELDRIQSLLPKIQSLAAQTRSLLLPTAINTNGQAVNLKLN